MQVKDYYSILELSPSASQAEIKKSFRRLALTYHPDKNAGNSLSEAMFKEIQEAYEVLSDPGRREEYNYRRWYTRITGSPFKKEASTPKEILAESKKLSGYVAAKGIFQVDYDALSHHIRRLLSDGNINILLQYNDAEANDEIVTLLIRACQPLPWPYIQPIAALLHRLADGHHHMQATIDGFEQYHRRLAAWKKYRIPVIIIVTILLCLLVYFLNR